MRRFLKTISALFIMCMLTYTVAAGQDKKTEKKIKVIVADESGTKIILDTLISDGGKNETIKLDDGNVVYIRHAGNESALRSDDKPDNVFFTVTSDVMDSTQLTHEITVLTSDSLELTDPELGNKVFIHSKSNSAIAHAGGNKNTVVWTEKNEGDSGQRIKHVYIDKSQGKESEKSVGVWITRDVEDSDVEKTRYVIAKDGIVVTVEGTDEAKTKELISDIEKKLGVERSSTEKENKGKKSTDKAAKK